jgi:hypothetical protein
MLQSGDFVGPLIKLGRARNSAAHLGDRVWPSCERLLVTLLMMITQDLVFCTAVTSGAPGSSCRSLVIAVRSMTVLYAIAGNVSGSERH